MGFVISAALQPTEIIACAAFAIFEAGTLDQHFWARPIASIGVEQCLVCAKVRLNLFVCAKELATGAHASVDIACSILASNLLFFAPD